MDDAIDGVKNAYEGAKDTVEGNNEPNSTVAPLPSPSSNDTQKTPRLNFNNNQKDRSNDGNKFRCDRGRSNWLICPPN